MLLGFEVEGHGSHSVDVDWASICSSDSLCSGSVKRELFSEPYVTSVNICACVEMLRMSLSMGHMLFLTLSK